MATLALSLAGQVVGGLVGGPFGATIGRALGALAGSRRSTARCSAKAAAGGAGSRYPAAGVDRGRGDPAALWLEPAERATSSGRRELEELGGEDAGAKGIRRRASDETMIGASFAVAFCEGEVQRLGRIWADGQLLDTEGLTLRFYRGTEDAGAPTA